jgi:hypothetical protein
MEKSLFPSVRISTFVLYLRLNGSETGNGMEITRNGTGYGRGSIPPVFSVDQDESMFIPLLIHTDRLNNLAYKVPAQPNTHSLEQAQEASPLSTLYAPESLPPVPISLCPSPLPLAAATHSLEAGAAACLPTALHPRAPPRCLRATAVPHLVLLAIRPPQSRPGA